jgi:deoxyribose-phosphate aldolase
MISPDLLSLALKDARECLSITNTREDIISLLDLTLLDTHATADDIHGLAKKAATHSVAAICIFPNHLSYLPANYPIKRATVVNFPAGNEDVSRVLASIESIATRREADEIDYVFPYQQALAGQEHEALEHCQLAYECCKRHGLTFKVILETGAFDSMEKIYQLSLSIIRQGCDFLKTSTGKIATGATPSAAFALLSAIKDSQLPCGIKFSGGVRTLEEAHLYLQLAEYMLHKRPEKTWLRIGASSLLDQLINPTSMLTT